MRLIDADKLFEEIRHNDLEYRQQIDLMICLKDIIDRQPIISETLETYLKAIEFEIYESKKDGVNKDICLNNIEFIANKIKGIINRQQVLNKEDNTLYEIFYSCTDDNGNEISSKIIVSASSKEKALDKYNEYAVKNNRIGMDDLNNVHELKIDIE